MILETVNGGLKIYWKVMYTCSWWCVNELTPSYTLNLRASKDQGKKINNPESCLGMICSLCKGGETFLRNNNYIKANESSFFR